MSAVEASERPSRTAARPRLDRVRPADIVRTDEGEYGLVLDRESRELRVLVVNRRGLIRHVRSRQLEEHWRLRGSR